MAYNATWWTNANINFAATLRQVWTIGRLLKMINWEMMRKMTRMIKTWWKYGKFGNYCYRLSYLLVIANTLSFVLPPFLLECRQCTTFTKMKNRQTNWRAEHNNYETLYCIALRRILQEITRPSVWELGCCWHDRAMLHNSSQIRGSISHNDRQTNRLSHRKAPLHVSLGCAAQSYHATHQNCQHVSVKCSTSFAGLPIIVNNNWRCN